MKYLDLPANAHIMIERDSEMKNPSPAESESVLKMVPVLIALQAIPCPLYLEETGPEVYRLINLFTMRQSAAGWLRTVCPNRILLEAIHLAQDGADWRSPKIMRAIVAQSIEETMAVVNLHRSTYSEVELAATELYPQLWR